MCILHVFHRSTDTHDSRGLSTRLFLFLFLFLFSGTYVLRFTAPVEGSYTLRIDYEQVDGILGK